MTLSPLRRITQVHYAWVIVGVVFFSLLAAQAIRSTPGVIIVPLEKEFGWDRATISLAVAVSLIAFGLGGPLGGSLIDRLGPRLVMLAGEICILAGLAGMLYGLHELWQLFLLWGVLIGVGTGAVGGVLGAAVAQRWFRRHRGVIIGLFGGATSAGQLIFIPPVAELTVDHGWRTGLGLLLIAGAVMLLPVLLLMRDRPEQVGARMLGAGGGPLPASVRAEDERGTPMRQALRTKDFWLLAGSFFVCGYTSNGLIGTHLIPHAVEHGFTEVTAASALGLLGAVNILGTLASGWLTDRYDNRKLLAAYYAFRALSLFALPLIYEIQWLFLFAIVYGLDWIATVPPTANLVGTIFGRRSLGTIYGWVFFSHMIGAALAAYAGGFFRVLLGDYHVMFVSAGIMGFIAVNLALRLGPGPSGSAPRPLPSARGMRSAPTGLSI